MRERRFAHSQSGVLIVLLVIIISACGPSETYLPTVTPNRDSAEPAEGIHPGNVGDWLQIYFTDPDDPHARDYEGGPDEVLAAAIDQARLSVDVAVYSLTLWSIEGALLNAHQRGVEVRMVVESDNMDSEEVQRIKDAGIPIIGDQREGLMHNKFFIIDRSQVWTGSMNPTVGGAYRDNNNLISMKSQKVAQAYSEVFDEMFSERMFGPDRTVNYANPTMLDVANTDVEIYFSPEDKPASRIIELIQSAQESVYFMAYTLTSNDIGAAIMDRAQAGLSVAGVMDDGQIKSSQGTEYDPFLQAGLKVRLDGNQDGLMHHKVIIIDQKIVITGSYNFTASAEEKNDENVVIIFSPEAAAIYYQEYQRVYDQAQGPEKEPIAILIDLG
jgi:phosphatidylserine/phosphatidylglycerophosphate/cardiolipin synthase-like enzyme